MKSESGINNRWELLEQAIGIDDLKHKFNGYGWYQGEHVRISKDEHWSGWWNDCYNFVCIFPETYHGKRMLQSVSEKFAENDYTITPIINSGISITYETMTPQESHEKARQNLLAGGRMSD